MRTYTFGGQTLINPSGSGWNSTQRYRMVPTGPARSVPVTQGYAAPAVATVQQSQPAPQPYDSRSYASFVAPAPSSAGAVRYPLSEAAALAQIEENRTRYGGWWDHVLEANRRFVQQYRAGQRTFGTKFKDVAGNDVWHNPKITPYPTYESWLARPQ
jgi:hypothetical protein